MKTSFAGGRLLLPEGWKSGVCLNIENSKITSITQTLPQGVEEVVDLGGALLCPGLIDLHVHGGGGYDFMEGTEKAVTIAAQTHLLGGTTTLLPTTVCSSDEEVAALAQALAVVKKSEAILPHMPGLHLEGPFLSLAQSGAQDPKYICEPLCQHYLHLLDVAGDVARMTVAVELPGALALGDLLNKRGILAAIGHSDADYSQVLEAVKHGYTHVTHLYSGMSTIHRVNAMRVLGIVESSYLLDELTVEIIADGYHLPPELLRLILKTKPHDKIMLVTDALSGTGLPEGSEINLGSNKNGRKAIIENGVAYMPDKTCFAGSVTTAIGCLRTMTQKAGLPLEEAIGMMTVNPARALKIEKQTGGLIPGMDADLLCLDEGLNVEKVYVSGRQCVADGKLVEV